LINKNKTKNVLLILLLILAYQQSNPSQQYWELLDSPTTENLNAVCFTDSLYGWTAGFGGTILRTTNGGEHWEFQDAQTENSIEDIFFIDRNLGWAVYWEVFNPPNGTYVLRTTDGGDNWVRSVLPQENIYSKCIYFLDSLNGWMGGKSYPIVRTTDGGISWIEAQIDSSTYSYFPVYDIQFYNSNYGYASGGTVDCCGVIWWTTDGGDNWCVTDTPYVVPEPIYKIFTFDSVSVLGVGGDFEALGFGVGIIESSDGGGSWNFDYIGISGVAWDIDFRTNNEAWAPLGGEQKLIFRSDYGNSWATLSTPENSMILRLTFPDSLHGFGVGLDGAIIKYNSNVSSAADKENISLSEYILEQNYPNPFNPSTTIRFQISRFEKVQLKIFNVLGNQVSELINKYFSPGDYEVKFEAGQLPSGIYFYTLYAGNFISSKKMVLLR